MSIAAETGEVETTNGLRPDPRASAEQAGLDYVTDADPGFRRRRCGRGFLFTDHAGIRITDPELRERLDGLVIPPAWTDVWISPSPDGHLQATGRDEKGRKQYIYHPRWGETRSETKFGRMVPFGERLPAIRERTGYDLRKRGLPRDKVLATVVRLLDATHIRVGNDEYARDNQSYGLTTLRDKHVKLDGSGCVFTFKGKSGKEHCIELDDPRLVRIIQACKEVPGYELFQYYDPEGGHHAVSSQDVNAYLRETSGQDFTAKDFRTWAGSVEAAVALHALGAAESERQAKKNVVHMVKQVAEELGNTTAVCRAYYIHPVLLDAYMDGTLLPAWQTCLRHPPTPRLSRDENALLNFLRGRSD